MLFSNFQAEGNTLYLVGEGKSEFGGSLYMKEICGTVAGKLPSIDYKKELALWELVIEANKKSLLAAAKDCSSGGVAIALAKMAATSGLGVNATITTADSRDIFAESMHRAVIEVAPSDEIAFEAMAYNIGLPYEKIGQVGGSDFIVNEVSMPLEQVDAIYFNTFKEVIEQDL